MRHRYARRPLLAVIALVLGLLTIPAAGAQPGSSDSSPVTNTYIVVLAEPPLASYRGGIADLEPTNPATLGAVKLDVDSAASVAYLAHLASQHDAFLAAAGDTVGRPLDASFAYRYALNGLAVDGLTAAEASDLRGLPGVAQVIENYEEQLLTDAGPAWIGAESVWDGSQTPSGMGTQGEGVVVGIIDSGINFAPLAGTGLLEHPYFIATGGDGYVHENPRDMFYGACDPVTGLPFCNDKLIGVWDFTGTGPQDDNNHGSHTASTTAGNVVDPATVTAPTIEVERPVSGVAPHANVIAYKGCVTVGSCVAVSTTAAIDQATADGVDVINYSIGGASSDPWTNAGALAFLGARDGGVFVAASAGNSGPGASTIGSPSNSPWVASVGAATHNRAFGNGLVDLTGPGTPPGDLDGKSFSAGTEDGAGNLVPFPIIHASSYDDPLCQGPAPASVEDMIVVCDRGVNGRVEKGSMVAAGGAAGVVIANTEIDGESTNADAHALPATHLGFIAAQELAVWMADGEGHMATITPTVAVIDDESGDVTASFSSRGPDASVPDVLKPDIIAPGVDVLAALGVLNPMQPGVLSPDFGLLSGTSMSSPHVAGAAALVRAANPGWTPAEVQSALMSTALDDVILKDDGTTAGDPFDEGAGRVDLTTATRAGLILDETSENYLAANPAEGGDPTTLNQASLADSACEATCTWTRTVRNPRTESMTWSVTTESVDGLTLSAEPQEFTIAAGDARKITVTADVTGHQIGEFLFGAVRFASQGGAAPDAHWPVAVAPGGAGGAGGSEVLIESNVPEGSQTETYDSQVTLDGLDVTVSGLEPGVLATETVTQDPTPLDPYDTSDAGIGTFTTLVDVPPGARLLIAETGETTSVDLDLYVGLDNDGDGFAEASEELCASATATAQESCRLTDPESGTYWILVQNWLGTGANEVNLLAAVIPGTDENNLDIITPDALSASEEYDLTYDFDVAALDEDNPIWFGLVELGSQPGIADVGSIFTTLRFDPDTTPAPPVGGGDPDPDDPGPGDGDPGPGDGDPGPGDGDPGPGDGDPGPGDGDPGPGDGDPGPGDGDPGPGDGDPGPGGGDPGDGGPGAPGDGGPTVSRAGGDGRVETAVALSQEGFDAADQAVVARADQFPDALAAVTLAAEVRGPLLLSNSDGLSAATAEELQRLGVQTVSLAGGTSALSTQVEEDLAALGIAVQRVGGADRFETAAVIAHAVVDLGGPVEMAIIARADQFPDALAAGNLATVGRAPILLTSTEDMPDVTMTALEELLASGEIFIAGGVAAVGTAPEAQLVAAGYQPQRLAGDDRYGTAVAALDEAVAQGARRGPLVLASGVNFPDALAGVPLAFQLGGGLLLVAPDTMANSPVSEDYLTEHAEAIGSAIIAGGEEAISAMVAAQVQASMER